MSICHIDLFKRLQQKILHSCRPFVISDSEFLKTHKNKIAALNIVCTRPKDLTRADLKNLRLTLDVEGFTIPKLNTAVS